MILKEAQEIGIDKLKGVVENSILETRLILEKILKIDTVDFIVNNNQKLKQQEVAKFLRLVRERQKNIPLAYVLKSKHFWQDEFYINKNVLIPRADSETLISAFIEQYKNQSCKLKILEIGVGSGCLMLSILQEYKNAQAYGVDISKKALKVARKNIHRLEFQNRAKIQQSDIFNDIGKMEKFDAIISNPPYIAFDDENIKADVKLHEPEVALFAKNNGLYFYEKILKQAKGFLKEEGILFFEIGFMQKQEVENIAQDFGYQVIQIVKDLGNRDRVMVIKNL